MATLKITLGQVSITDHLKIVLSEVSSPLSSVYTQLFAPPHSSTRIFTINDLNAVNHYVKWYRSDAGGALIELLHTTEVDIATNGTTSFELLEIVVNGGRGAPYYDPAPDQPVYTNPDLIGVEKFKVDKRGYGFVSWEEEIEQIPAGGFQYKDGQNFIEDDRYMLTISKKISAPPFISGKEIGDVILFNSDLTINSSHYGKLLCFNFAGLTGVATMPALNSIPNMTPFIFNTHQGNQINGEIAFQVGNGLQYRGELLNKVYLGKGEELKFVVKDGVAYALPGWSGYHHLGKRELMDVVGLNQLLLNGNGGTMYDGFVYKRAWWYITNKLPALQKVTFAEWEMTQAFTYTVKALAGSGTRVITQTMFINRGFFAVDTALGARNFKVPDDQDMFYRALFGIGGADGTRPKNRPGGYQHWGTGPHEHEIFIPGRGGGDTFVTMNDGNGSGKYLKVYGDTQDQESRGMNRGLLPCVNI